MGRNDALVSSSDDSLYSRTRHLFAATALSLAVLGCSSVPPQIRTAVTPSQDLSVILDEISKLEAQIDALLAEQFAEQRFSRIGVAAGMIGSGAAALFGAHRDLIVGGALLAASSYQLGNLNNVPGYVTTLKTGQEVLLCVRTAVQPMSSELQLLQRRRDRAVASGKQLETLAMRDFTSPNLPPEVSKARGDATAQLSRGRVRIAEVGRITDGEARLADQAYLALVTVRSMVNTQLVSQSPTLDGVLAASRAVLAMVAQIQSDAVGLGRTQPPPPPQAAAKPPVPAAKPSLTAEERELLIRLQEQIVIFTKDVDALEKQLKEFENATQSQTALAACPDAFKKGVKGLVIRPNNTELKLTAAPTPYVISAGSDRAPVSGRWIGSTPPVAELEVGFVPAGSNVEFRFTQKTALGSDYQFEIFELPTAGGGAQTTVITFKK